VKMLASSAVGKGYRRGKVTGAEMTRSYMSGERRCDPTYQAGRFRRPSCHLSGNSDHCDMVGRARSAKNEGPERFKVVIWVSLVGKTLIQLRDAIADAIVNEGLFSSVTVNLTLLSTRLDFANQISLGDNLFLRILGGDGTVDPSSGSFTVDGTGSINILFLGGVLVGGSLLFEAEHQIEQGLIQGGFFTQPFVNVTRVQLS
jgi:protein involved in polysaccharide export with SLBB domain